MHGTNPYAQAGWYNPLNPHTINILPWGTSATSSPSIFGALPHPSQTSLPTVLTFRYVLLKPDILDCMITGPTLMPYLEVVTISSMLHETTIFRKNDGRALASIEWTTSPIIEVIDCIPKQPASQWLAISEDRTHRTMNVNGKRFMWVTRSNCVCLFSNGEQTGEPLAKIFQAYDAVILEMTTEAFGLGLLEAAIAATVLLQSGRHID